MALRRLIHEGPTITCPFCDTTVRAVYNPHTGDVTTYHGEDALFAVCAEDRARLDLVPLTARIADALLLNLLALHVAGRDAA